MVREFRSMSTSGKSKKSAYLPYLIYGAIGILFGLVVARMGSGGNFFSSLQSYIYLLAIFVMFMLLRFFKREKELQTAGMKPWNSVVSVALDKLNDEYLLLADVKITTINNARWEIDYLIVGPNGVFLLEIRTEAGNITVSADEPEWIVTRKGKRSNVNKTIFNPLLTTTEKVTGVKEILSGHDIEAAIYPVVVFFQEGTRLSDRSLPVVTLDRVVMYIKSIKSEQRLDFNQRKKIAQIF